MSVRDKLANTFLPSEAVSRERRLKTFGREEKSVAGAAIIGGAALVYTAPAFIVGGGAKSLATSLGARLAAQPLATQIAVKVAAPPVLAFTGAAVATNPQIVPKTAGQYIGLVKDSAKLGAKPSKEALKDFVEDNKGALAVGGAVAVTAASAKFIPGLFNLGTNLFGNDGNEKPPKETKSKASFTSSPAFASPKESPTVPANASPSGPSAGPATTPLTPQTQVLGSEVASGSSAVAKRRKAKAKVPVIRNSVRVNILNRNSYIGRRTTYTV